MKRIFRENVWKECIKQANPWHTFREVKSMKCHRPRHIGIIPDGNRRWAAAHGLPKEEGYQYGLKPGLMLLQQAKTDGIEEITYYGFTVDNCKRPKEQVQSFQKACVDAVDYLSSEGADLLVVGNAGMKNRMSLMEDRWHPVFVDKAMNFTKCFFIQMSQRIFQNVFSFR